MIIGDMSRKSKSTTIVIYTYSLSPVGFTLYIRALLGDDYNNLIIITIGFNNPCFKVLLQLGNNHMLGGMLSV